MSAYWGFPIENITLAGPGIRIGFSTENAHHAFGAFSIPSEGEDGSLRFGNPMAGDRLIFSATFENQENSKRKKQNYIIRKYLEKY